MFWVVVNRMPGDILVHALSLLGKGVHVIEKETPFKIHCNHFASVIQI